MGVISITQRSERLGNLGGTSAAHGVTNTNIGQVNHTVARTFSPHYYSRNSHAGDDAITSGLGKIGDALTRIGVAVMQREEDRKVDDYANAMLDNMEKMGRDDREVDDWNTPDRKHLQGQKKGFYLRTGEGTKTVVDEWDRAFGDTFRKIGDSIDANDRVRERTMEKLASYRRSTMSRLADRQASEYRRMELDSAKGNLATQRMIWKNGRTEVLPDIFAQQERVDSLQLATPEKRKANREALAVQLAADFVDNSLQQCASAEDFDKVEEAVKGGLKDALPDLIADNLPGGEHTVDGEYRKALLDGVKKSKRLFLAEKDAEEREARKVTLRQFTEKELQMRDIPQELWPDAYDAMGHDEALKKADPVRAQQYLDTAREMRKSQEREARQATVRQFTEQELLMRDIPQELWPDAYEKMGRDEALRKDNPKLAMAYMDAAREMRTAASKAKEKALADAIKAKEKASADAIKGNEENLARALATIDILKMDGSYPQDAANEAQAAIWRKFRTLSLGNQLSPSFMRSFETRLSSQLSDQEANAMRKFYAAFGYRGEVNARGEIPASDRKNDTSDYAAPRNPGDRHSENYFRIPANELFVYGDTLLRTLRALGPDMNREGVVEKEIARLKTDWGKRQYDKNREATVRSVMDMQREARVRWELAQPDKRSNEDDRR